MTVCKKYKFEEFQILFHYEFQNFRHCFSSYLNKIMNFLSSGKFNPTIKKLIFIKYLNNNKINSSRTLQNGKSYIFKAISNSVVNFQSMETLIGSKWINLLNYNGIIWHRKIFFLSFQNVEQFPFLCFALQCHFFKLNFRFRIIGRKTPYGSSVISKIFSFCLSVLTLTNN